MRKTLILILFIGLEQTVTSQSLDDLRSQWEERWSGLDIPTLQLAYHHFINQNLQTRTLKAQTSFFESMAAQLEKVRDDQLGPKDRLDWNLLRYETTLNLQRLKLIEKTRGKFQKGGIFKGPLGKQWYAYLIKHWTSADISPEEVTTYGWEEINRIKTAMKAIKNQHEIEEELTRQPHLIEKAFDTYRKFLEERVWSVVPDWFIPDLAVRQGTNASLSQVPGYYGGNVLSYNLFDDPFDLSQIEWLYLHEGIPGHHFQLSSEGRADIPQYRIGISYSGFREGWAAYVEELAHEQNWYSGPAQRISQMKWDLIRSVRLILDVGINYEGWSDEKALEVWQSVISDSDAIGQREIARMRRWPAQVLTYKVGTKIILTTREKALGDDTSKDALRAFHSRLLSKGSMPMALVPQLFGIN